MNQNTTHTVKPIIVTTRYQVSNEWSVDWNGTPYQITDTSISYHIIAKDKFNEDVGWLSFIPFSNTIMLNSVYVEPEYRHSGVFNALFNTMVQDFPDFEVTGIFVNENLNSFVNNYNEKLNIAV